MLAGTTLLWVGALAWYVRGYFVDDAYITFRFVDNLWLGQGFLFNPPERLEGITNLGWALVLIPLRGLISVPDAAKVLGLVSLTVGLWLVGRIGRRLFEPGSSVPAAVVLATAASAEYCYFSLAGMETGLAALLGLLAIRCLQRRPEGVTAVSIVAAGLFLVRPEYLIAFPLYLASGCLGRRRARTARSLSIFIGA
ncbi:MAG: hypothetical protein OEW19_09845, partial [Acidobacteriota bacterium]|nr:hypothetical protein [Acidobacteriota bacterium]